MRSLKYIRFPYIDIDLEHVIKKKDDRMYVLGPYIY